MWYVPAVTRPVDKLIERYDIDTVVAALTPLVTEERKQRIEAVLDARLTSLSVALENLHDPHNGAAAIRSVEAFGLTRLHVIETKERFRSAAAVTIGCEKWISIAHYPDFAGFAGAMRAAGVATWAMVARTPGAEVTDIDQVDVSRPLVLVFGNERDGLSREAVAGCDGAASLPMFGFTRSFNLSVSVALAVQRLAERRRAHLGTGGDLGGPERALLRARWYVHSVRGADKIIRRYVSETTRSSVVTGPRSEDVAQ